MDGSDLAKVKRAGCREIPWWAVDLASSMRVSVFVQVPRA